MTEPKYVKIKQDLEQFGHFGLKKEHIVIEGKIIKVKYCKDGVGKENTKYICEDPNGNKSQLGFFKDEVIPINTKLEKRVRELGEG